ncbi:MAG: hypothetical protein D6706_09270 [Chloroflexi bacterium]|nr:MAG: hypothetical protein D6706_09270 [Chloroflexota bacterium]
MGQVSVSTISNGHTKTGRLARQQERARIFIARQNPHLLLALVMALAYHGGLAFYTFGRTYDAYVHIFFADHYARWWFDPWDYRWYTGFTLTSYPPGSQQSIALLSKIVGLQHGFVFVQTFAILMCVLGIYRFSKIWVSEEAAGYAALLMVFSSSITETIHVFGQLPTTFSLGFLLNALPYAYRWLSEGDWRILIAAWIMNAATTAGHHVTTLFGAVFFVAPVMALAILEKFRTPLPDEPPHHPAKVTRKNLKPLIMRRVRRIVPVVFRCGLYGVGLIVVLVIVVLPYWLWSKNDPIAQVPIPHASRDSFIENTAAGLVFWLVPYGVTLIGLPYAFYKGLTTKAWPMTLSLGLLFVLGTGGTTPIPRLLLRGAFDILTLDRFTFWATITVLPLLGEMVVSLRHGRFARYLREQFGRFTWRTTQVTLIIAYIAFSLFTANLTRLRRFQPDPIDMKPIVNFIEKDQHWRWRYLTLGFGDQVAWLGAQTTATSVDGNYHSARRLPELTTTPVERLEGAKFRGIPGIGSLQQFLAVPDKYNLKFVFSNDQFYDPLLYFSGWHRLQRLENGIMVWERADIPPLPEVLPRKDIPVYQRLMWGIVPMSALIAGMLVMSATFWGPYFWRLQHFLGIWKTIKRLEYFIVSRLPFPTPRALFYRLWYWLDDLLWRWSDVPAFDASPVVRWQIWLDWFQALPRPKPAPPTARQVRTVLLFCIAGVVVLSGVVHYRRQIRDPIRLVEAYYDDLDFRRFREAYERLDPETRPSFDQYRLELSVTNGLVASYGKLDSIYVSVISQEPNRMVVEAKTELVTALQAYTTIQRHVLVQRNGRWYIVPDQPEVKIPPDEFFRRAEVAWHSAGRRRVATKTTEFSDILDRPELQILSARLVKVNGRYSVVGELINTDADPADVTVTAFLFDAQNNPLTWYNAQAGMIHKLLPKEVTPFRVDFEGVAGAVLEDLETAGDFKPDAFSPIQLDSPIDYFEVYAKAVVTDKDLYRDVAVQDLAVTQEANGRFYLNGRLLNNGPREATIPHILVTFYDENNQVVWVDHYYVPDAIRPQREQLFSFPLTPYEEVETLLEKGDLFANILETEVRPNQPWLERLPAPPGMGYAALRVSVHYFIGNTQ